MATYRRWTAVGIAALAAMVLLVGAMVAYPIIGTPYGKARIKTVDPKGKIAFTVAAGERVVVFLKFPDAVGDDLWASSKGLSLVLPGHEPVQLAAARVRDWGDSVMSSSKYDDTTIRLTLTVPDATASGTIEGDVTYPASAPVQGCTSMPCHPDLTPRFADQTDTLKLPVAFTVAPTGTPTLKYLVGGTLLLSVLTFVLLLLTLVSRVRRGNELSRGMFGGLLFVAALLAGFGWLAAATTLTSADEAGGSAPSLNPLLPWWVLPTIESVVMVLGFLVASVRE